VRRVLKIFYSSRNLKIQTLRGFFKNDAGTQTFFINNWVNLRQLTSNDLFYSYTNILGTTRELVFFNSRIKKYYTVLKKLVFLGKRESFFKDDAKYSLYFYNKYYYRAGKFRKSLDSFKLYHVKRNFSDVFLSHMMRTFFFKPLRHRRLRAQRKVKHYYEVLLHTTFDVKHRKFLATKRDVLFIALRWSKMLKNRIGRSVKIELLYNANSTSLVTKQFIGSSFKQFLFTRIYQKYDEGVYKYIFNSKTYLDNLLSSGVYNNLKYFNKIILPGTGNTQAD
jgi:hypothetical protein